MPPPTNASAGSAAQTLRQGTSIVGTRLLFDMLTSWELPLLNR
jgi:hypothetical protein